MVNQKRVFKRDSQENGKINVQQTPPAKLRKVKEEINGPIIVEKERGGITSLIQLKPTERQLEQMNLGKYDYLLREGNLQEVVNKLLHSANLSPEFIVAAFQQIRIRQQLDHALSNMGMDELSKLLVFLRKHWLDAPFFDILYDVTDKIIEIYAHKPIRKDVRKMVLWFKKAVSKEISLQREIHSLNGIIGLLKCRELFGKRHLL